MASILLDMERVGSCFLLLKLGKYVMGKRKSQHFTVSLVLLSYTLPNHIF